MVQPHLNRRSRQDERRRDGGPSWPTRLDGIGSGSLLDQMGAAGAGLIIAFALVVGVTTVRAEEPGVPGAAEAAVLELQGLPGVEPLDDSEIGGITVGADDRLSGAVRRGPIVRGEPVQGLDYSANRLGTASPLGFVGPAAQNPAAGPSAAGAITAFSPF